MITMVTGETSKVTAPASFLAGVKVMLEGLSTDTKPTDVLNGSGFYEMDTTDYYKFDEENHQWRKQ